MSFTKEDILIKKLIQIIIIVFIFTIIISVFTENAKSFLIKLIYKIGYSEYVEEFAEKYNVEKELIYAIIKVESNFDENAVSKSNAKGLMQIMTATAQEIADKYGINLTEENITDPKINIEIGTIYISQLLEKYNNKQVALAAYNAGQGNVNKWITQETIKSDGSDIENIPFPETNMYVRKVMRDYNIYKDQIFA
mgnify:CR=1 FL=1